MMTLRNVQRSTLATKTTRELERMVVTGEWSEGTKIPAEPELVRQLGVSRNTVREAVRALTHVGLLEARPGDGTYVRSTSVLGSTLSRRLDDCDPLEVLEVRQCLETEAARLAASRHTEEDVARLRSGFDRLKADFDRGEPAEVVVQAIFDHHLDIVKAGHNPLLLELYQNIADSVRASIEAVLGVVDRLAPDMEPAERLHRDLIEAIASGDGEAAARLVVEHSAIIHSWLGEESTP